MKNRQKNWQFLLIIGMMCVFLTACAADNKTKLHADEPAVPDIPAKYIDAMQEYQEAQGDAKSLRIHGDILVTGIDDELLSEFFVLSFLCDTRDASGGYSKQLSVEIGKYADNDAVFSDSNSSQFINFRGMYASSAKILNDESIPETAKADLRENIESFNYEIISGKTMADAISCEYIDDSEITDDDSWVNTWGKTLTDESAKGTLGEKNALKKAKQYLGSMAFCTAPGCADSTKRPLGRKNEVLSGEASRKRHLSSFQLDAFIIIKVDKFIYELPGLLERFYFLTVNTLCLENGEEIFRHSVVITVSPS